MLWFQDVPNVLGTYVEVAGYGVKASGFGSGLMWIAPSGSFREGSIRFLALDTYSVHQGILEVLVLSTELLHLRGFVQVELETPRENLKLPARASNHCDHTNHLKGTAYYLTVSLEPM